MSRRAQGHAVWTDAAGREVRASDTFTCCHCGGVVHTHDEFCRAVPVDDLGGYCMKCDKSTCGPCADLGECVPVERRLVAAERGVPGAMSRGRDLVEAVERYQARMRLRSLL